jgi:hypothetical protein
MGCTAVVSTIAERDKSVQYTVAGVGSGEIFADERQMLHSAVRAKQSSGAVRFIDKTDFSYTSSGHRGDYCGNVSTPCDSFEALLNRLKVEAPSADGSTGLLETLVYGRGKFSSSIVKGENARSSLLSIVGCGAEETEVIPAPSSKLFLIEGAVNQSIVLERLTLSLSSVALSMGIVKTTGK